MTAAPNFSSGNFLPENISLPKDQQDLFPILNRLLEDHASMINRKDTGQYETVEIQCNQTFPGNTPQDKKYVYRKIFTFGAVAAGATLNIVHNITGFVQLTDLYGTCITNVIDYRPIPFVSVIAVNQGIQLLLAGANIVLINGAGAPPITSGYIICEFLKS